MTALGTEKFFRWPVALHKGRTCSRQGAKHSKCGSLVSSRPFMNRLKDEDRGLF